MSYPKSGKHKVRGKSKILGINPARNLSGFLVPPNAWALEALITAALVQCSWDKYGKNWKSFLGGRTHRPKKFQSGRQPMIQGQRSTENLLGI